MKILQLLSSFCIGATAYIFAMCWVGYGDATPTLETPGIAWYLNAIGLVFWIISYIAMLIENKE